MLRRKARSVTTEDTVIHRETIFFVRTKNNNNIYLDSIHKNFGFLFFDFLCGPLRPLR